MDETLTGNILWKRPYDYITDHRLGVEISLRYPTKNVSKLKKYINDLYIKETCPVENKGFKINEFLLSGGTNDLSLDNKRLFKDMFKIFENEDFFIVKHIEKEADASSHDEELDIVDIDNGNEEIKKSKKEESSKTINNIFNIIKKVSNTKHFTSSRISIEENSGYFTKWISSILQFIREFEINDVIF